MLKHTPSFTLRGLPIACSLVALSTLGCRAARASEPVPRATEASAAPSDAAEQKARARQQVDTDAQRAAEQKWDKQQYVNGGGSDHPAIDVEQQETRERERIASETAAAAVERRAASAQRAKPVPASAAASTKRTAPSPRDGGR